MGRGPYSECYVVTGTKAKTGEQVGSASGLQCGWQRAGYATDYLEPNIIQRCSGANVATYSIRARGKWVNYVVGSKRIPGRAELIHAPGQTV